ncbi:hypothetical protein LY90DRAFT_643126 [Neocallimastix californiae]|uniref:Scaffoldin n=1 Tax=Neocallimastix californiae TaxID=1754190 RepID=A0A1Y1YG51_9FUNG|nr:hypothetical protein LY90DRAFT_643126 [Neocallimastix californiae]|eukprot:ORX96949.1 hypothetical protein LY90DRAFT_643126 [Neocallimastix californiae]
MLGWKYFCLFYLLLLYQLQYALAAGLDNCENEITDNNCFEIDYKNKNCLQNGFIYRVGSTESSCVGKLTFGVHIFASNSTEIDLTLKKKITDTGVKDYSMYVCSESGCVKTTGYILINELYVFLDAEPEDWNSNLTNYYEVEQSDINPLKYKGENGDKAVQFMESVHAKKEQNSIFIIGKSGATKLDTDTNELCNNNSIGKFNSNDGVCLGMNSSGSSVSLAFASGNDDEYILINPSSGSVFFSISNGNDGILLKHTPNVIYYNNSENVKNIIIINKDTKKKVSQFSNSELNDSDLSNYYIYECEQGKCNKKHGHNIVDVSTMKGIDITDSNLESSNVTNAINSIIILNCDDNSCKRTFGYFKTSKIDDVKYYSISYDGSNKLMENGDFSTTECSDNNTDIGKITNEGAFCQGLYRINDAMTGGQSYIISANSQTIFYNKLEGKSLVISATSNTLIYNGLSTNEGIQLFGSGVLISTTKSDITDKNEDKLVLYYCNNNGICHSLKGYIKDNKKNYYKVEDNKSEKINFNNSNYECTKEAAGNLISNKKLCLGNESIDFIDDDTKTEYYIYNKDNKYLFVRGVKNMFTIEEFNGSVHLEKFNVINTEDVTKIDIENINANDLTNIITNLTLFNCDIEKEICRQTYGYIKSKDNTYYYSFDANKSKPNKVVEFTSSKCSDSSDIGTLQTEGKLCLIDDSNNPKKESMTDGNNYVISVSANNIFSGIEENIVIRATNYAFYYDNLYDVSDGKNVVLTDADTKITEITENTDVTKLKVYLCNTSGICTQVDAFIEKDDKYYQIINSNASEITESLSDTCTINNLLKGGKLCITGSNNDAINFIKDDTISYYMTYDGTNYKLVIAKKNLFIVAPTSSIGGSLNLINLNDATITDLASGTITSDDLPYLALFSCQTTNKICKRTYGYIKMGNSDSSKYYTIDANGLEKNTEFISNISSCDQTDIGKLDTSGNLCIKDENSLNTYTGSLSPSESYIVYNNNRSVFSDLTDINIYITSTSNAFYHDKFVDVSTDGGVKLFQSNKLISPNSISSNEALSLYICNTEGICLQAEGYANDNTNYYNIRISGSKGMENADFVNECSEESTGKLNSNQKFCTGGTESENYPDKVKNYIIYEVDTKPRLVKTASGLIAKVEITEHPYDGLNIYRIESSISKFKSFDKEIETETLTNLYFFNCNLNGTVKKCQQTYGYLRGANTIYEINFNGTKSAITSENCTSGTIGSIASETVNNATSNKFCLNTESKNVDFTDEGIYVIDTVANNVFTDSTNNSIVTNSTSNVIFYDNFYRGNEILLTASNIVIEVGDITTENDTKLKVYSCEISGICSLEGGFVTNGSGNYYSISKDSQSKKIDQLKNSCNGNIGELITEGKLCINDNDNEAVAFLTNINEKKNYIVKGKEGEISNLKFITSIPNMFLISSIEGLTKGVNLVNNKISKKVKPTDDNLDIPNLALYYCIEINNNSSDLSCKKTTGYIKINDNGNQNFYSIGWNGNNDFVTPNNVCSPGLVGQLGTSDKLCLGSFEGELSQTDQSITYIIKPPISGSVFANISDENILIYADTNSFVFENIVDISNNHGVKLFDSNKLIDTNDTPSSESAFSLFICKTEGVCTGAEGYTYINNKYYKIQTSESSEMNDSDYIDSCSLSNAGKLEKNERKFCIGDTDSIPFPTSYKNYIINEDGTYKFVKTIENIIAKISLKDNDGTSIIDESHLEDLNLIDCEKAKIINISDDNLKASLLTPNISNLALFRCENNDKICKQTYGYLVSSDVDDEKIYYSFAVGAANGITLDSFASEPTCGDTDFAKIQKNGGELCLNSSIKLSINDSNIYSISTEKESIFSKASTTKQSVIVRSNGRAFYLDNYYKEKGVNLFVSNTKSEATLVTDENINNTSLSTCTREGICTDIEGYIKHDNTYYKIADTDQSVQNEKVSDDNFGKRCSSSDDGVKLLSYGKLCLGMESIEFFSEDKKGYYIGFSGGDAKFIRAIKNIFTIEALTDNALSDGANLVNVETTSIVTTPAIADITPVLKNLLYFNCDMTNSVCKQTVGYLKANDATTSSGYYAIYNSSDFNDEVVSFCTSNNIEENGKLTNDGKLCSGKVWIELNTSASNYIISKPNDSTPFKSNSGEIIIVSATNTNIILNNLYGDAGPNLIDKEKMMVYKLPSSIDADIVEKLLLFNCGRNGICLSNTGYITDGNKYYEIKNKIEDTSSTLNKNKECTFSENIGEINKGHELVINTNESIPFLSDNEKADYIIKEGTLLVRAIPGIFSIGSIINPLNENGLYGVIRDSGTAFKLPTLSDEIEEGLSSLGLYDCNEKKICKQTYGYLKSTNNDPGYYSLSIDGKITRIVPDSICNEFGLIKDWKLCLKSNNSIEVTNGNIYIIDATKGSVFSESTPNSYVMLKAKSNSLTLKIMDNSYHVSKNDGNVITAASGSDLENYNGSVGIYGCERKSSTCTLISGYAIFNSKYYIFKENTLGATEYTTISEIDSTKPNYCQNNIGLIVTESSKYYLCLGDEISVELSQGNDGNYIAFEAVATGSPLEAKKMIKYSNESSVSYIVNDKYFEGKDRNYVIKVPNSNLSPQENYYLYLSDNGSYSLNDERSIGAYKQLNEGNIYEDISSELSCEDSVYLFFCESGECIETIGYMNIDSIMYTNDNTSGKWEEREKTNNCSPLEYNYVSYDGSQLKVCMRNDNGNVYSVVDQSKDYMIAIGSTNSYQKFIGNSGSSIIGKPDEKDGYYLIKENIIITDTSEESNIIVICQNSECTIIKAEDGYYPDANGNAVIHCTSEGENITCKLEIVNKSSTFIDAGDTSHLIYCEVDTDNKVYCSSFESNASEEKQEHYVSGDEKLITCTFNGEKPECVIEGSTFNGYFIDSAPQQSTDKKIIRCADLICEEIKISELNLTGPGSLKNDADSISIEINKSTSIKVEIGCETSYQSIDVEGNVFPGVHEKSTISVKIDKDGSIIYLEDTSLETCESSCTNEVYCWDSQNNKIQTEVNQVCENINGKNHCTFVEGENLPQEKCILVKGYLISKDNKILQCNGWKREGCTIVENSGPCVDGDEGRLGEGDNGKEVCFGKNLGVPLPTKEDEVRYVAFQVNNVKNNNVNEIYGKNKGEIVFLALTKNSVLVVEDSEAINEGIYLNWSAKSLDDGLIDCTVKGSIEECDIKAGLGYYLDASYYINADVSNELPKALIRCPDETYCIAYDGNPNDIYINNDDSKLIQCNSDKCLSVTENTNMLGNSNIPTYFKNADEAADDSSILIKCSGTCITISAESNSVFLNGNLKVDITNDNGESGKPLIICYNKSYSGTDASSIECKTSEAEGAESYYINAGDYIIIIKN